MKSQGIEISDKALRLGFSKVSWPGRFEFIYDNVLVDCAHNPEGVMTLKNEVKKIRKNYNKVISVVGILKDKDRKKMVKEISSFSDYIIFTKPNSKRASEPEELASYTDIMNETVYSVRNALKKARKLANEEDLVIVAGSIYTVGEIR
jgi:dihydrofolate synthase/folylpolyglutamate synthase